MSQSTGWLSFWKDISGQLGAVMADTPMRKYFVAEFSRLLENVHRTNSTPAYNNSGPKADGNKPAQKQCSICEEHARPETPKRKDENKKQTPPHGKSAKDAGGGGDRNGVAKQPKRRDDCDRKENGKPAKGSDKAGDLNEKPKSGKDAGAGCHSGEHGKSKDASAGKVNRTAPAAVTKVASTNKHAAYVHVFSDRAPNGPLSQAESDRLGSQLTTALMKDFGFTRPQAAGIVGNLSHESAGLNPHVNEFGKSGYSAGDDRNYGKPANNQYGYGWAQWSYDRKTKYLEFARERGMDPGSPKANYAFLAHELRTSESGTVAAVKKAKTVDEAAIAFRVVYERAEMPNDSGRLTAARRIYSMSA